MSTGERDSVAGVLIHNRTVLLGRRMTPGSDQNQLWEIPGGKCRQNESHCGALKREFLEELGLNIDCGELLASTGFEHHSISYHVYAYQVSFPNGEFPKTKSFPDENPHPVHSQLEWFNSSHLRQLTMHSPDKIVPSDLSILGQLLERKII